MRNILRTPGPDSNADDEGAPTPAKRGQLSKKAGKAASKKVKKKKAKKKQTKAPAAVMPDPNTTPILEDPAEVHTKHRCRPSLIAEFVLVHSCISKSAAADRCLLCWCRSLELDSCPSRTVTTTTHSPAACICICWSVCMITQPCTFVFRLSHRQSKSATIPLAPSAPSHHVLQFLDISSLPVGLRRSLRFRLHRTLHHIWLGKRQWGRPTTGEAAAENDCC